MVQEEHVKGCRGRQVLQRARDECDAWLEPSVHDQSGRKALDRVVRVDGVDVGVGAGEGELDCGEADKSAAAV